MHFRSLQTRFLAAGALLVAVTVACGIWSAITFARLSTVVDDTLRDRQETIDLAAVLAGTLEREDDALLLALTGKAAQRGPSVRRSAAISRPPTRACYRA